MMASPCSRAEAPARQYSSAGLMRFEPVDDLTAGRLPDPGIGVDVPEHFIQMPDAPRLSHDPRMQMQHHHPACRRAVGVKTIEPVTPHQVDLVDGPAAVEMDEIVVEVGVHT